MADLESMRGKTAAISPIFWPAWSCPQASESRRTDSIGSGMPSCNQIFAQDSGRMGESSAVATRKASAEVYSVRSSFAWESESCFLARVQGACSTMNLSTAESRVQIDSRPLEKSKL